MKYYVYLVVISLIVLIAFFPWMFGWILLALIMGVISIGLLPHTYFEPNKKSRP